jgi:hypothetical protein
MKPDADLQRKLIIRSNGLYWAMFDVAFESTMRDFAEHAWERAEQSAQDRNDYTLMVYNEQYQELERQGTALVFIPMVWGSYSLEFSVFLANDGVDFNLFTNDRYTRDWEHDIGLSFPSGELCVAELGPSFSIAHTIAKIPAGTYRACCLSDRGAG